MIVIGNYYDSNCNNDDADTNILWNPFHLHPSFFSLLSSFFFLSSFLIAFINLLFLGLLYFILFSSLLFSSLLFSFLLLSYLLLSFLLFSSLLLSSLFFFSLFFAFVLISLLLFSSFLIFSTLIYSFLFFPTHHCSHLFFSPFRASQATGIPTKIYAVEKNLHAVITLRNRALSEEWENVQIIEKGEVVSTHIPS